MKRILAAVVVTTLTLPVFASDDGAAVYKGKCAMCHGATGAGDTTMGKKLALKPLASPEVQKNSDQALHQVIEKGKGKMPAFGSKLTAEQITQLVSVVRAFAKK